VTSGPIRVGVGGWDFEPWRGTFFPQGLPKSRQLGFSSRALTAIEVNGTFYKTQKPETFRRWAEETPDGFVFSLKAPRYVVNRRDLSDAGGGVSRFLESGVTELGPKLGPILWQLAPAKKFEASEIAAFLELLPHSFEGREISHALEVRHASFLDPAFADLARRSAVPVVYADSDDYPAIADLCGPLVYARLQRCQEAEACGYPDAILRLWAERARLWAAGEAPADLPYLGAAADGRADGGRPVYLFFISGAKVRAPAAAQALLRLLV
jgi:uncharacterized protein YecE (DUF72 family)